MNVKKSVDYSLMFAELDTMMKKDLPQMELYCKIGRLANSRPKNGSAFSNTITFFHLIQKHLRCRTEHLVLLPDDIQLCFQRWCQRAEAQLTIRAGIHQFVKSQHISQSFPRQNAAIISQVERSRDV